MKNKKEMMRKSFSKITSSQIFRYLKKNKSNKNTSMGKEQKIQNDK